MDQTILQFKSQLQALGFPESEVEQNLAAMEESRVARPQAPHRRAAPVPATPVVLPGEAASQAEAAGAAAAAAAAAQSQAEAEAAFRQNKEAFTCRAELFSGEALARLAYEQHTDLHSCPEGEIGHLQCCGHAGVEDLLDAMTGWLMSWRRSSNERRHASRRL